MNPSELDGRIGEGWGGLSPNGAHVNVVLARRGSPTAAAAVGMFAHPAPGHTPVLVCVGPDQPSYEPVWPPTLMMNKATALDERFQTLTWGAAQLGIAQVETRRYVHPFDPPVRVAWDPVPRDRQEATLVIVRSDGGVAGYASGDALPDRALLERQLVGLDPFRTEVVREVCETVDLHGAR